MTQRRSPRPPPRVPPPAAPTRSRTALLPVVAVAACAAALLTRRPADLEAPRDDVHVDAEPVQRDPVDGPRTPGPLRLPRVELTAPAWSIDLTRCEAPLEGWWFAGRSLDAVRALAREAGGDDALDRAIVTSHGCDADGCLVETTADTLDTLPMPVRNALYRTLAQHPANRVQVFAAHRDVDFGPWSALLPPGPARDALDRLTWRDAWGYRLSDVTRLCAQIPSVDARREALAALARRTSLDPMLTPDRSTDLAPMVRYWSRGNRVSAVREALREAAVTGAPLPVRALLPTHLRERALRFPTPDEQHFDCFATALSFLDPDAWTVAWNAPLADAELRARYAPLAMAEATWGDVLALRSADGALVHLATVVEGDVVFTRNGANLSEPWAFVHLDDLLRTYPFTRAAAWRRRP